VLKAGDVVVGGVRGVGRGIKGGEQAPGEQAPKPAPKARSSRAKSSESAPNAAAR
jgi:hypothetical protein